MSSKDFWAQVYIAAIRADKHVSTAKEYADRAVEYYLKRYPRKPKPKRHGWTEL